MEGIKARIEGSGVDTSVEFSIEEVIAQHRGKPWGELSDEERENAMKAYAIALFARYSGASTADDLRVSFDEGTFSRDTALPRPEGRQSLPPSAR
jgi:hypothetical protein